MHSRPGRRKIRGSGSWAWAWQGHWAGRRRRPPTRALSAANCLHRSHATPQQTPRLYCTQDGTDRYFFPCSSCKNLCDIRSIVHGTMEETGVQRGLVIHPDRTASQDLCLDLNLKFSASKAHVFHCLAKHSILTSFLLPLSLPLFKSLAQQTPSSIKVTTTKVKVAQSCPILCGPVDYTVHPTNGGSPRSAWQLHPVITILLH